MKKMIPRCLLGLVVVIIMGIFCIYRFVFWDSDVKTEVSNEPREEKTYYEPEAGNGVCYTYYKDEDGKWYVNGRQYDERVVLTGKMPGGVGRTVYVVLTNNPDITFEEVNGSTYSNNSSDFLNPNETCIVEINGD